MMLSYLLWRGKNRVTNLGEKEVHQIIGDDHPDVPVSNIDSYLREISNSRSAEGRDEINRRLAERIGVDYLECKDLAMFYLMDNDDLRRLESLGCGIELHGHRHLGGLTASDKELFRNEIETNRRALALATDRTLSHYCYPSGCFREEQADWLRDLGIVSATTCEPGTNTRDANVYALHRFLDREDISDWRFLAEVSGVRGIFGRK